jgi:hypothetical protein
MLNSHLPDKNVLATPKAKEFFEGIVEEGEVLDHCLAGLVNLSLLETGRREGNVSWGGTTRCFWASGLLTISAFLCVYGEREEISTDEWNSGLIEKLEFVGFMEVRLLALLRGLLLERCSRKFEKAVYESFATAA